MMIFLVFRAMLNRIMFFSVDFQSKHLPATIFLETANKQTRERERERDQARDGWKKVTDLGRSFLRIIQLKSLWGCNEFHGITSHHCNPIFDWIRTKNPNPLNWSLRISFFSCAPAFIPYKYTCVRAKMIHFSLFEYEKLFDAPGKWLKSLTISFHYWSRVECLIA